MSRFPPKSDQDSTSVMQSLPGIRKLKQDKVDLYQQKPKQPVFKRQNDTVESGHAFQPVSHSISRESTESWFHHGIQKKLQKTIRMGKLPIDAMLDLHGYRQHEAIRELESFFQYALKTQARFLLIIHGKGFRSEQQAKIRPLVQHWLSEQSVVLAYCPAQIKDGGSGASYVYIRTESK